MIVLDGNILSKLSKLQRRAARVITGQTYGVRFTQILNNISWKPFEDIFKRKEFVVSFKAPTEGRNTYLQELFNDAIIKDYWLSVRFVP